MTVDKLLAMVTLCVCFYIRSIYLLVKLIDKLIARAADVSWDRAMHTS